MGNEYDALRSLEARMHAQETKYMQLSDDVHALKEVARANNEAMSQFLVLAQSFKFGFKILGAMEVGAVWLSKMAMAVALFWGVWKFLVKEAIAQIVKQVER